MRSVYACTIAHSILIKYIPFHLIHRQTKRFFASDSNDNLHGKLNNLNRMLNNFNWKDIIIHILCIILINSRCFHFRWMNNIQVGNRDTLTSLAARFDTTPGELTSLNKLNSSFIYPGQSLLVPDKTASSVENISEFGSDVTAQDSLENTRKLSTDEVQNEKKERGNFNISILSALHCFSLIINAFRCMRPELHNPYIPFTWHNFVWKCIHW